MNLMSIVFLKPAQYTFSLFDSLGITMLRAARATTQRFFSTATPPSTQTTAPARVIVTTSLVDYSSVVAFAVIGYFWGGGKELIAAKTANLNADTAVKEAQAEAIYRTSGISL